MNTEIKTRRDETNKVELDSMQNYGTNSSPDAQHSYVASVETTPAADEPQRSNKCRLHGLGVVVLAVVIGLAGTFIVINFVSFRRPVKQFAVVVDAGSSGTRSTLYEIEFEPEKLSRFEMLVAQQIVNHKLPESGANLLLQSPLNESIKIRELGKCYNGPPLAAIRTHQEARELINRCTTTFELRIQKLQFLSEIDDNTGSSQQVEHSDKRVNSLTKIFLGATAGMRELRVIYPQQTEQTMKLIDSAIATVNDNSTGPFFNKRFVGILEGKDEALFSWLSVNFFAGRIFAGHNYAGDPSAEVAAAFDKVEPRRESNDQNSKANNSHLIGMIELGGASAQIAYQLKGWPLDVNNKPIGNGFADADDILQERAVSLFNSSFQLVTRSDLCIGMDQATRRADFLILRQFFRDKTAANEALPQELHVESPCYSLGFSKNVTKTQLEELSTFACLEEPVILKSDVEAVEERRAWIKFFNNIQYVEYRGLGDADKCSSLLGSIIDKQQCDKHFRICAKKPTVAPPSNIPFITISGYNYALENLIINKSTSHALDDATFEDQVEQMFNAGSVSFDDLLSETRSFCSTPYASLNESRFSELVRKDPIFADLKCLRANYVRKLIVDFYLFNPESTWNQLKFMIFEQKNSDKIATKPHSKIDTNNIGWTLGLLLNDTSSQFDKAVKKNVKTLISTNNPTQNSPTNDTNLDYGVMFHHSASLSSLLSNVVLLFLAIFFVALLTLTLLAVFIRNRYRKIEESRNIELTSTTMQYNV